MKPIYASLPTAEIVRDYQSGETLRELASKHRVSYGTLRRLVIAVGVPIRDRGRRDPSRTHIAENDCKYDMSAIWSEPDSYQMPQSTIDRLRRAVGWDPSWALEDADKL